MMEEIKILIVGGIVALGLVVCLFLPIAWFEGHAKSRWLKETKGVEIPWYESTFLSVEINSVDASINGDFKSP